MPTDTSRSQSESPPEDVSRGSFPSESSSEQADHKRNVRILVVDNERMLCESCESILSLDGYSVQSCHRADDAIAMVRRQTFHIALIDARIAEMGGIDFMRRCLELSPSLVPIMMTGHPSVEASLEAFAAGAWDYLPKPFSAMHLQVLVGRAAHLVGVAEDTQQRGAKAPERHGHSEKVTLIGRSPAFCELIDLARKVASTDASVFLSGESGTGKEMIAQFLHHHSRRSNREMVAINCAALPETLLESEMFGHRKGAFTGAVRDKPGLLETANGGTLFLDELTEMPQTIQAKLLRVIQDGVVRRLGSETTDAIVNVRFIAATNRDPYKAMAEGVLREDLYYRLRVVPMRVPSLRERPADIETIATHFLAEYWRRHRSGDDPTPTFTAAAMRALTSWGWPGNVRELQNVIEHAVVLLDAGSDLDVADLRFVHGPADSEATLSNGQASGLPSMTAFHNEDYHSARERLLGEFERSYLVWLVEQASANMSKAARIAGVDRTTLYRLMEKHGFKRDMVLKDGKPSP